MSRRNEIEARLRQHLEPDHLELEDESHRHSVPPGSESHFRAVVVSPAFAGKALLARHRLIHQTLGEVMQQIHALTLHTYTPQEWAARSGNTTESPPCLGGGKAQSA